jgi:hypothetical protein
MLWADGVCHAPRLGTILTQNLARSRGECVQRPQEFPNEPHAPLCTFRHSYAITSAFKMRTVEDETFKDVSKRMQDQAVGRSLGDCKHCAHRRLFLRSVLEPVEPACTEPHASLACSPSGHRSFDSHRSSFDSCYRSFDDRAIDDHDASDHNASDRAANDTGTSRSAYHFTDAIHTCSEAGA